MNQKLNKGFTVVEVIVSATIFIFLALIIAQVYVLIVNQVASYREQTTISSLADQYMEVARNLPYSKIGTLNGNPHGNLADSVNPIVASVNGVNYQIYYVVNYVDDPADGTIAAGTDMAPNDYKQVKLYIKNTRTNFTNSFLTNISPQGLEGLAFGGALSIKVFDAVGQPISGASINIKNTSLSPGINLNRTSDTSGNWIEVGLPDSSNSYHIAVTKNGYSFDQTYPISSQNPNPVKPDATIANGQVTQISFSIDKLSNLAFSIANEVCSPLSGIGMEIKGTKLIGVPNVLKFDNNYTSDSSGQVSLNNIEWDTYTPALTGLSYMIYGSSPIQQANILPDTSQNFSLIIGPKTTNSLLVIVKDAASGNAIEGANVDLQNLNQNSDTNKTTAGSIWSQNNWSSGPGQADFVNVQKYYQDDGNISNNDVPSGLRLASFNNVYSSSATLTSSAFDTGTNATAYTTLSWQPTSQDPSTEMKFQLAANNDDATWNYLGPDGTSNSYYTVPGTTINPAQNNSQYIRYKAFFSTTDTFKTPVLTSVNINYVSGCFTPGQAMFAGLSGGSNYQVTVNKSGYQSQTISDINISGYNVLQVLLSSQ